MGPNQSVTVGPLLVDVSRNQVLPYLGRRKIGSLRQWDVEKWMSKVVQEQAHLSPATVNASHRVLKLVLQKAEANGFIGKNPARGVACLKVSKKKKRLMLPDEVERLAEAVPPIYRALILLLAWSGLRFGEAIALKWENVDLLGKCLWVEEGYSQVGSKLYLDDPKTQASKRKVSLDPLLVKDLQAHMESFEPGCGFSSKLPTNSH
jgi:integrase